MKEKMFYYEIKQLAKKPGYWRVGFLARICINKNLEDEYRRLNINPKFRYEFLDENFLQERQRVRRCGNCKELVMEKFGLPIYQQESAHSSELAELRCGFVSGYKCRSSDDLNIENFTLKFYAELRKSGCYEDYVERLQGIMQDIENMLNERYREALVYKQQEETCYISPMTMENQEEQQRERRIRRKMEVNT